MHFPQLLLISLHCLNWFIRNFQLFSFTVRFLLQASQLLRQLCMQNMVWTYCKRISPEWKQQVRDNFLHHFTNYAGVPQNRREFSALVVVRNEGGEQLDRRDKGTATGGGGHSSIGEVEELLNHCILLWLVNNSTKTLGFFF